MSEVNNQEEKNSNFIEQNFDKIQNTIIIEENDEQDFFERISLVNFNINGSINLYKNRFLNNRYNDILFDNKKVIYIIVVLNILLQIFLLLINPNNESTSNIVTLAPYFLIPLFIFGPIAFVIYIRKLEKFTLYNIFNTFSNLNNIFTDKKQRFKFVQYIHNNKQEFKITENTDDFKKTMTYLKVMDKNNDVIGFSLLSCLFFENDIVTLYQNAINKYDFIYNTGNSNDKVFNYLNEKIAQQNQHIQSQNNNTIESQK